MSPRDLKEFLKVLPQQMEGNESRSAECKKKVASVSYLQKSRYCKYNTILLANL